MICTSCGQSPYWAFLGRRIFPAYFLVCSFVGNRVKQTSGFSQAMKSFSVILFGSFLLVNVQFRVWKVGEYPTLCNLTEIAHTGPIFKELKLLKFHDIHSFQLGTFMFSFENSTLPSKFNNFFLLNSQIHNYNTRNAQSFRLPLCRTNTRKFSIYFQGPNFYNSLNSDITSSPSSASFKRKLKEFLLSRY